MIKPENPANTPPEPVPEHYVFPASFAQERLWFLDQLEPGSSAYHIAQAFRMRGALDTDALQASINAIVACHESLRTFFSWQDQNPVQVITSRLDLPMTVVDLSSSSTIAGPTDALVLAKQEAERPFELNKLPLLRVVLYRLAENDHVLLLVMHHIISDGWSMEVMHRELAAYYRGFVRGESPGLPELPIQYADYAVWQRKWLEGERIRPLVEYWKQTLDRTPVFELPTDFARPATQSHEGRFLLDQLSPDLGDSLRELSRSAGVTLFMTMLAVFDLLLSRWSRTTDVTVGTPIAGRDRREIEDLIGFFLNSIVLRTDLSGNPTFSELLARVRNTALGAYEHQELAFEKLLEVIKPERDPSRSPLFQVFFNMQKITADVPGLVGLEVEALDSILASSPFDLTLYVHDENGMLNLKLAFNKRLFATERMQEFLDQYILLLSQVAAEPAKPIGNYTLVTPRAISVLPDPTAPLSKEWRGAIQSRLAENASRNPEKTAIVSPEGDWSYRVLDRSSNKLANGFASRGVERGNIVAIYAHRSAALVWAIMGVLKAGAATLILDPAYPASRLITYLQIAKPKAWVQLEAAGPLDEDLERYVAAQDWACRVTLPSSLDNPPAEVSEYSDHAPNRVVGADDIACVTFTSGTTGIPKGVLGRHGPLTHFLPWQADAFGLDASTRFSMLSGLAHDPLQRDIFTPLWLGATICIPHPETFRSPSGLAEWMAQAQVSFAFLTPAMASLLTETADRNLSVPTLRGVIFVGDKLTKSDVDRLRKLAPNVVCTGSYGATETQRAVGYYIVHQDASGMPSKEVYPSGHGMPGVQLLVLGEAQQRAGIGEIGEIYVRSPHLAKGYLDDEELTRSRFIPNPWSNDPEDRLYRTGDLGRYLPDGNVEFLGRADRQVKLRGFRIEPAEIESALLDHPAIQQAAVTLVQRDPQDVRLAAYLVTQDEAPLSTSLLRSFLRDRLPDYMIPTDYVVLPRLPLTPNLKIDFAALPAQPVKSHAPATGVPLSNTELRLAKVWQKVLGVPEVERDDDFFDLGGHSLIAVRLFAQIEAQFGKRLPVALLFRAPTLEQLAQAIEGEAESAFNSTIVPITSNGAKPPFFCVHGLGGGVLGYSELARKLGPDRPFYGLQALGLYGEEPHRQVETMAAYYVKAMRQVQSRGPYYVGGYCYGGIVAFEMARQLESAGEPVGGVAIFEGYAISRAEGRKQLWRPQAMARTAFNLPYWLIDYGPRAYAQMRAHRMSEGKSTWQERVLEIDRRVALLDPHELAVAEEIPPAHRRVIAAHLQALREYHPPPYGGRVTLFRVRALSLFRAADPAMGWGSLARGGVDIRIIPGAHHNILERPYVNELAKQLEKMLEG